MGLLDFPLEIIDSILDLSLPYGIEGFALSSRAVYERAAPQIRRHNALKRKWRRTSNHQGAHVDDTLRILYEISCEPIVADYIEELDLWDDRWKEQNEVADDHELVSDKMITPENFRQNANAMEAIKSLISRSLKSLGVNVDMKAFWDHMTREEPHPENADFLESSCTVIGLLSLLPNIHSLRLPGWWDGVQDEAGDTLDLLVKIANSDSSHGKPLSKLKTILPSMHDGYEEKRSLQGLLPLLTLRSLAELHLVSVVAVDDGYTGIPFNWLSPSISSSITRLELVACCMDADGLSGLIQYTPGLSIFRYSHETKWHACEHDWNPGTFAEALGHFCGNTITELSLTIDGLYGEIVNGASSFLSFAKLEKLEVDIQVFCGPPVESGQRCGIDAFVPEGDTPWAQTDIPCIGSMLPDSIKEAQINIDHPVPDAEALRALLKNLVAQRAERLHKLERVVIRQYNGDSASEITTNSGAILETFDANGDETRMDMPEWKRNFKERVARVEPVANF